MITKNLVSLWKGSVFIFVLLGILFIPFPFKTIPFHELVIGYLFEDLIQFVKVDLLTISTDYDAISSDSSSLYALFLILMFTALIVTVTMHLLKKEAKLSFKSLPTFHLVYCYYLSFQLISYGFDKLSKGQFYLPEPNTLYTPLGFLDKDLLFWSTVGVSHSFNVFIVLAQLIPGILLFFRKTRMTGLILSCTTFLGIVVINFSFDISLKLYSAFLLCAAMISLGPYIPKLYQAFDNSIFRSYQLTINKSAVYSIIKSAFILFIFLEVLYPHIHSRPFNSDLRSPPPLHGAYEVTHQLDNGVLLEESHIKRIFIHRGNYLIIQNTNDEFMDYKLQFHPIKKQLLLTNYDLKQTVLDYDYSLKDNVLQLGHKKEGLPLEITAKPLPWKSLPLLQKNFHWMIDFVE